MFVALLLAGCGSSGGSDSDHPETGQRTPADDAEQYVEDTVTAAFAAIADGDEDGFCTRVDPPGERALKGVLLAGFGQKPSSFDCPSFVRFQNRNLSTESKAVFRELAISQVDLIGGTSDRAEARLSGENGTITLRDIGGQWAISGWRKPPTEPDNRAATATSSQSKTSRRKPDKRPNPEPTRTGSATSAYAGKEKAAFDDSRDLCSLFPPGEIAKEYGLPADSAELEIAVAYAEQTYVPPYQAASREGCLKGLQD